MAGTDRISEDATIQKFLAISNKQHAAIKTFLEHVNIGWDSDAEARRILTDLFAED